MRIADFTAETYPFTASKVTFSASSSSWSSAGAKCLLLSLSVVLDLYLLFSTYSHTRCIFVFPSCHIKNLTDAVQSNIEEYSLEIPNLFVIDLLYSRKIWFCVSVLS